MAEKVEKTKRTTYVSVVKAGLSAGKTEEQILADLAIQIPTMDAKKAKTKLPAAIKYVKAQVK